MSENEATNDGTHVVKDFGVEGLREVGFSSCRTFEYSELYRIHSIGVLILIRLTTALQLSPAFRSNSRTGFSLCRTPLHG